MKKVIYLFLIVSFVSSCRNKMVTEIIEDITYLAYEDMKIDEDSIFRPSDALLYEDKIILIEDLGRKLLKVIDLSTGKIISQSFIRGRGPEEVSYISFISQVFGEKELFYILDGNNRRLTFFNIDSLISNPKHVLKKQRIESIELRPHYLQQFKDSRYLAMGFNTLNEKRLMIFNEDLESIGFYLNYPISKKEDPLLNNFLYGAIFQYGKALRPDGKRMANVLYKSDYFEIIDLEKSDPEIVYSEYSYLPEYKITGEKSYHGIKDSKTGYKGVKATQKYIFLLYSQNPKESFTDMILVTDWKGNPLLKFELEMPIRKFVRDSDHRYLYGFSAAEVDDGHNRLIRYELKGLN